MLVGSHALYENGWYNFFGWCIFGWCIFWLTHFFWLMHFFWCIHFWFIHIFYILCFLFTTQLLQTVLNVLTKCLRQKNPLFVLCVCILHVSQQSCNQHFLLHQRSVGAKKRFSFLILNWKNKLAKCCKKLISWVQF